MRIPLTAYGWPQVFVWPAIITATMVAFSVVAAGSLPPWVLGVADGILAAVLIWALSFFRDPERACPSDNSLVLAPADGRITDITVVDDADFVGGKALRIGIFLSIFNVHINRSPCNVKVEKVEYRPGKYKNAMNPESGRVNESNNLYLTRSDKPCDRLIVRQVSGAIARRIVCTAAEGQTLSTGERFGMIKFGSRTELYIPSRPEVECMVSVGQPVKAGQTVLMRYERCPN